MFEEEYEYCEKRKLDSFTVMARAIQRYYNNDDEKIPKEMTRAMAKIIDDGFLNSVIAEQVNLIAHSKRIADQYKKAAGEESKKFHRLQMDKGHLEKEIEELEDYCTKLKSVDAEEADPFLSGAKKAYLFILHETGDKDKACKSYNSYLQGIGKWKQATAEKE